MEKVITSVNYVDDIIQVKMKNVMKTPIFIARIFEIISEQEINIDMISQVILENEMQLAYTCDVTDQTKLSKANEIIKKEFPQIEIYQNKKVSKIYVHGKAMEDTVGVATKMFEIFGKENIPFYQITTSSTSISYLIDKDKREQAMTAIKNAWKI
ncbi:MAG: ACT domain-containing protein [Coprobacillaceae bacterium]